jgi:uncharacterized protein
MAKSKFDWLKLRRKTAPEIPYEPPVWMGPLSNGEFFRPETARDRKIRELILRRADDHARRLGMDRREFMASAMGMVTTLSVLNLASGCGDEAGFMRTNDMVDFMAGRDAISTGGASGGGGGYVVSNEACQDEAMAEKLLNHDYFVLDFQTHHVGGATGPSFGGCDNIGSSPDAYVTSIFENSDTTVAVLSGLPSMIDPATGDLVGFSNAEMTASRDRVNKAALPGAERMIAHCQVSPRQNPAANAEMMARSKNDFDTRGWKCYPPTEGGWFLHEHPEFIQSAIDLNEPLICAHKGFPLGNWSRVHADPMPDVGRVATMFPDVNFVIYHSAYDSAVIEGPYAEDPDPDRGGTDRLSKVVSDNGLAMKNVYAEMGAVWVNLMRDPVQASHYIGKMLKYVGVERLVWGSECTWFGSPQCQLEALKTFRLDPALAEMHGYPDFTEEVKRNMFGLTGAKLYRIDPAACRQQVSLGDIAMNKRRLDEELGPRRFALGNRPAITTRRQFIDLLAGREARGEIA